MERLVVELLQAPEIQRLRRIRQLGLVHLVYPGAEHSRFVHSLGASYLAGTFVQALRENTRAFVADSAQPDETAVRDLMIAGLCHDIGHGPLSHVWEQSVVRGFDRSEWLNALGISDNPWIGRIDEWHEIATQALLLTETTELHKRLENVETGTSARVAALLAGDYYLTYLPRLLGSDVDVDRADFVARDAYQTGVAYGRYDLDWMRSTITLGYAGDEPVVGFDQQKGSRVIEQFLIARRALYEIVYHHPTARAAEQMVALLLRWVKERAVDLALLASIEGFDAIKTAIRGEPMRPDELLQLDDHQLWVFIGRLAKDAGDSRVREIAGRVIGRDLFRPVPLNSDALTEFYGSDPKYAREVVGHALRSCGCDEEFQINDRAKFRFYNEESERMAYFVDRSADRRAEPIREHEALIHHARTERVLWRVFVPREAVDAVTKAIRTRRPLASANASPALITPGDSCGARPGHDS